MKLIKAPWPLFLIFISKKKPYLPLPIFRLFLFFSLLATLVPLHAVADDINQEPSSLKNAISRLRLSGLIEVEATDDDNESTGDSSAIDLATIELGLAADINDYTKVRLIFLWEENNTEPAEVDEASITFSLPYKTELTAGKMYLPFGVFHSHFITDPQTLELGETREQAVLFSYKATTYQLSAAIYDGKIEEDGKRNTKDYVASLILHPGHWLSFGLSYNSDLADSDGEHTRAYRLTSQAKDTVSGTSAFIHLRHEKLELIVEYLGANKDFDADDLNADGDGGGDRPTTYYIELAYAPTEFCIIALRLEGNKDFFGQPERQYGAVASVVLFKDVSASLEYLHGEYSDGSERNIVSAQLAIKF